MVITSTTVQSATVAITSATMDFVEQIKEVKLKKEESIVSYDVTALFTSVPIPPVLKIIEEKLTNDKDLPQRTSMNTRQFYQAVGVLLEKHLFCFSRAAL